MKQAKTDQPPLNIRRSLCNLRAGLQQFNPYSRTITLDEEVENSVNAFLINKGYIPRATKRDELKHILFHNLLTNREAKEILGETFNWNRVNFDIATTAEDCLAAYALVYTRYQPLGFNDLTLIDNTDNFSAENRSMISDLTYDDDDKRSVTVIIRGNNQLNGTLRLISGDTGLLPAEKLFNKQKGLAHFRQYQAEKGNSIAEI